MSENQKYFYMRLKENFFNSPELIAVESMDSGYLYSNILLKMYLLSLRENGRLMAGAIPYSPQMLSRATGHDVKTVEEAIQVFSDVGLIEVLDSGAIFMLDIQNFVGQSTTEADRKREYRDRIAAEKQATDNCPDKCLDKSTPYIDIELKREIERKTEPEEKGNKGNKGNKGKNEIQGTVNRQYTPPPSLGDMDKLLEEIEQRRTAAQNV